MTFWPYGIVASPVDDPPDIADPDFPTVVETDDYVDPRTIDDSLYGSFKYRRKRIAGKTTYRYSFKTDAGGRLFKQRWGR